MKNLLRLEELAQFLICVVALIINDVPWWVYLILLLGLDIGMLGYLVNSRFGAISYNALHHKGLALLLICVGQYMGLMSFADVADPSPLWHVVIIAGIILYGHSSMDRIFGYGLKFGDNFHHTHLGWIGKLKGKDGAE